MANESIGFIGLGIMGRPMAHNLLDAGFRLIVHDVVQGPVEELVAAGAGRAGSSAETARSCPIVVTMLPETPHVEEVLFGDSGVSSGISSGSLVIEMSSIDPLPTRRFAERLGEQGVAMLDAPVSGGEKGAVEGTLSIMVGGSHESFERALPLFRAMGQNITLVGESGAGQVAKACNQLIVGATIEAVGEALVLAAKAGVDPAAVRKALMGGFAGSKILELHGERMLKGDFQPGFRIRLHRKDARIVTETARQLGVPTPAFDVVAEAFERLVDEGAGELDHAALVTLIEREVGLELSRTSAGSP